MQIKPIFGLWSFFLTAAPLAGQEVNQLQSGMRVRVTAMGGAHDRQPHQGLGGNDRARAVEGRERKVNVRDEGRPEN